MSEPSDDTRASAETQTSSDRSSDAFVELLNRSSASARLVSAGIPLTLQRLAVAHVMFAAPVHLTAEQVLSRVRKIMPEISRASVYNILKLFREKALVREIIVDAGHVVFDSTTTPHYHLYDVDTGEVTDVPQGEIKVIGAPNLPSDLELEEIDVVARVRRKRP